MVAASVAGDEIDVPVTEGKPEDYSGREGYREDFLGEDALAPLPEIVRQTDQIVEFEFQGTRERALRYEHFSVVMSRKRRMCFYQRGQYRWQAVAQGGARRLEVGSRASAATCRSCTNATAIRRNSAAAT